MQATLQRQRRPAAGASATATATATAAAATAAARRTAIARMIARPRCAALQHTPLQARILRRGRAGITVASAGPEAAAPLPPPSLSQQQQPAPPSSQAAAAASGAESLSLPPPTTSALATTTIPAVVPRPSLLARPWRFPEQALDAAMGDAQRAQQAADWGYDTLGRVLPEELSVRAVAEAALFSPEEERRASEDAPAAGAAAAASNAAADHDATDPRAPALKATALRSLLSCAVIAAGYAWMWHMRLLLPAWQAVLCWLAIGTAYFGLFQGVGGDAAKGALLASRPRLRDALGAAAMAPALWPFAAWRARWWSFVRRPNLLVDSADEWRASPGARRAAASPLAVRPLTLRRLGGFLPLHRRLHRLVRATPLRFFGPSLAAWYRAWDALDLRRWDASEQMSALASWMAPMAFVALAWPGLARFGAAVAGSESALVGWALAWLGPWMVFHMWTSLLALAQRTGPHAVWARRPRSAHQAALGGAWDHCRALFCACATLSLPRWLEVLIHDANYHLPATVASACCALGAPGGGPGGAPGAVCAVPSPRLRAAHARLRRRLGPYLTEGRLLSPRLLGNLMTGWLVYDEHGTGTYMDWDDAVAALREERRQAREQQQQRAAAEGGGGDGGGGAAAATATAA